MNSRLRSCGSSRRPSVSASWALAAVVADRKSDLRSRKTLGSRIDLPSPRPSPPIVYKFSFPSVGDVSLKHAV